MPKSYGMKGKERREGPREGEEGRKGRRKKGREEGKRGRRKEGNI